MTPSVGASNEFRKRFAKQVLLPIGAAILAAIGLGAFGLYWGTTRSDAVSVERQISTTERSLSTIVDFVAYQQQSHARWAPLVAKLNASTLDANWLDGNIGGWFYRMFGHEQVFILDSRNRPIYAAIHGRRVSVARFAAIRRELQPLVDGVDGDLSGPAGPHDRRPGQRAGDSAALTDPEATHHTDTLRLFGRPAAVSVMRIAPEDSAGRESGAYFNMVNIRFLDGDYLRQVAARNLIDGLRFSHVANRRGNEQALAISSRSGERVGYFLWRPELPGLRILRILGPITLGIVSMMVLAMLMLARSLWRSGRQLQGTMVELQASEAQAQHLAFHDVLTGLPNRVLFDDRLEQALARSRRGEHVALLVLDLVRNGCEAAAGRPNARVTLSTHLEGEQAIVSVDDTGPGIAADRNEDLFEWSQSDKPNGMGVGLSISRAIVEAHGGRIWLSRGKPGRTRFCFAVPLGGEEGARAGMRLAGGGSP